jgi:hypothetical protein
MRADRACRRVTQSFLVPPHNARRTPKVSHRVRWCVKNAKRVVRQIVTCEPSPDGDLHRALETFGAGAKRVITAADIFCGPARRIAGCVFQDAWSALHALPHFCAHRWAPRAMRPGGRASHRHPACRAAPAVRVSPASAATSTAQTVPYPSAPPAAGAPESVVICRSPPCGGKCAPLFRRAVRRRGTPPRTTGRIAAR